MREAAPEGREETISRSRVRLSLPGTRNVPNTEARNGVPERSEHLPGAVPASLGLYQPVAKREAGNRLTYRISPQEASKSGSTSGNQIDRQRQHPLLAVPARSC